MEKLIILLSSVFAIIMFITWLSALSNIKSIRQMQSNNYDFNYLYEQAEIASFSNLNQKALELYFKALFYEAKYFTTIRNIKIEDLITDFEEKYKRKIEQHGGKLPDLMLYFSEKGRSPM